MSSSEDDNDSGGGSNNDFFDRLVDDEEEEPSSDSDDDDDDDDNDDNEEEEVDEDAIIDHPYLSLRYPHNAAHRTRPRVRRYERATAELLGIDIEEELSFNADGRLDCIDLSPDELTARSKTPMNEDIAVFDKAMHLSVQDCLSFPDSIKYLSDLEIISMYRCDDDFRIPSNSMSGLRSVRTLEMSGCSGKSVRQFFDIPCLKDILFHSDRSRNAELPRTPALNDFMNTMSGHEQDGDSGTNIPARRACSFKNSLEEVCIGFWDMTSEQLCTIVSSFLRGFPNVSKFSFVGNRLTSRTLDSLTQWLKLDARKYAESGKLDAKCSSDRIKNVFLRDDVLLGSTDGLRSVLRLLDVLTSTTDIGFYIGDARWLHRSNGITHRKEYTLLQSKVATKLNLNAVGSVLTSKGPPAGSKSASSSPSNNNDKPLVPVSVWTNVIYRASRKAPRYAKSGITFHRAGDELAGCFRMFKKELEKERKEWQASSIFFLIREGLIGQNEWLDRIGSTTKSSSSSSSSSTTTVRSFRSNRGSKRKHGD